MSINSRVNGRELSLYNVTSGDVCVVTAGCLLGNEPYNASGVVKGGERARDHGRP